MILNTHFYSIHIQKLFDKVYFINKRTAWTIKENQRVVTQSVTILN